MKFIKNRWCVALLAISMNSHVYGGNLCGTEKDVRHDPTDVALATFMQQQQNTAATPYHQVTEQQQNLDGHDDEEGESSNAAISSTATPRPPASPGRNPVLDAAVEAMQGQTFDDDDDEKGLAAAMVQLVVDDSGGNGGGSTSTAHQIDHHDDGEQIMRSDGPADDEKQQARLAVLFAFANHPAKTQQAIFAAFDADQQGLLHVFFREDKTPHKSAVAAIKSIVSWNEQQQKYAIKQNGLAKKIAKIGKTATGAAASSYREGEAAEIQRSLYGLLGMPMPQE